MEKLRWMPVVLRSLRSYSAKAPISTRAPRLPTGKQVLQGVASDHLKLRDSMETLDKGYLFSRRDACNLGTSQRGAISRLTHMPTHRSTNQWPTPIRRHLLTRSYSSKGTDPKDDFDWHTHIATGNFSYRGQLTLGIKMISLQEHLVKNPMLETRPVYGDRNGKYKTFVKDIAKSHCWNMINSLSEFHRIGLCIVDLDHSKIVICDGVARFSPDILFVAATEQLIKDNFLKLAKIIKHVLFQGEELPYDMHRLLKIMQTEALEAVNLMNCHVALVPQILKTSFYFRMYEVITFLRLGDYPSYSSLMDMLPYRYVWYKIMQGKTLLASSMERHQRPISRLARKNPGKLVHSYRCL
ncbi:hypothetical protein CFC21_071010 [Triticum aestivum]|uniref:Uncharacterized protein n=2 Tax=Triticum aestivum TaxID=4565 RepID=A0A9R1HG44_WHEAT|nr:uncharacterized protein LOC123111377 [Triticum aestivum]KAF7064759.1 hypothetical protein CFC21_071010 [Triticum aestivum]